VRAVPDTAESPNEIRPRDWGLAAVTVAPLIALAVVAIVTVGHAYHGAGDNAMTELRISDIGAHWPTIGPFSRDGWSHPGPALFYALLVPYRLTGGHSNGLLVGAALLNATAVGGMVLLARRRGGTALALLVALGALVVSTSLGHTFLWDPWNPYVTVLPFGLGVVATWCVVCGDAWCLPVVALAGTFCAQTHVGYVPLVAVLLVVAGVGMAVTARRGPPADARGHGTRAPVLASVALLLACWAAPVFQQLTSDSGNLWALWHVFTSDRAAHSIRDGFDVVATQFTWNPGWITGTNPVNPFTAEPTALSSTSWPVVWAAFAAAVAWSWHSGRRAARSLGVVLTVLIVASVITVARTLGPVFEYRLRFVWVLGMLSAAFIVWMAADFVVRRLSHRATWTAVATGVLVAGVVGISGFGVATAPSTTPPDDHNGQVVATLMPQLLRALPPGRGVVVPTETSFAAGPLRDGIMVDLEHHGILVRMRQGADDRLRFGDHRILTTEPVRATIRVAVDDELERIARRPCARRLAYWGRVSSSKRARAVRAVARIHRDLAAHRISGPVAVRRIVRLAKDLPAAAVFRIDCGAGTPTS
jgi:hypothetical protein